MMRWGICVIMGLVMISAVMVIGTQATYAASSDFVDVSMDSTYQALALKYMPTLIHESGTTYYTCDICFDSDLNVSNNKANYENGVGGWAYDWVYIHILENISSGYVYIEYWFYYVYNVYWYFDNHYNDWEMMIVVLNGAHNPVEVRYGAHGFVNTYSWSDVSKEDTTHPIAYVASGSHAMDKDTSIPYQLWWSGDGYIAHYYYFQANQYTFFGQQLYAVGTNSYMEASGYRYWNGEIQSTGNGLWPADYGSVSTPWTEKAIWNDPTLDTY